MNIKLKMYAMNAGNASIINNNIEKIALRVILMSFGALALLYVLLLGNMVSNILERRSLEASLRTLSSEVGGLELQYLSMANKVDISLAASMGFRETKATFAPRKTVGFKTSPESLLGVKILQNDL